MKKLFLFCTAVLASVSMWAADVELFNQNFKTWEAGSITAGTTKNGVYFKSAVTVSSDNGITVSGNASTSSNYLAIPLSNVNGSITIEVSHTNTRPQWKHAVVAYDALPASISNPSSVADNTRPGSNTTTSSWKVDVAKNYAILYIGKGSNGTSNIYGIRITTPAPDVKRTLTWDFAGGSCSATAGTDYTAAGQVAVGATITYPANNTMTKADKDFNGWSTTATTMPDDDLTITAQWVDHVESSDATLANLTVNGETVEGFDPATTEYDVELPFGTSAVPTVVGTANSTYAKNVATNQAEALPGVATIEVTAEDNSSKTYTINFTVATSKDIIMVWKTGNAKCNTEASYVTSSVILSTNDAVKDYLSISFEQTTETAANQADEKSGSYLSTGKSIGNLVKITAKTGYAFKAMSFYGKVETDEVKCPVSINGGTSWIDVTGTLGSDASHCDVFTDAKTTEIILKNNAGYGTWIRHMELTIIEGSKTPTALDNTEVEVKAVKRIENGMLVIEKDGKTYNVMGVRIR